MSKKQEEYQEKRYELVVKANDLIQKSRFNLTLQEQRIILYLISQITPYDKEFQVYEFNVVEFCRVCGIDHDNGVVYAHIKKAIKDIRDKSIWITLEDGTETTLSWIEKPYINRNHGSIKIRLDEDMKPFLLELKRNFTQYELIYTLAMKSRYSVRLYELIKSIHFQELQEYTRRYKLDDLRRIMGAEHYTAFRDFHSRALKPAIAEINKYTDKAVTYEPIKKGKATIGIEFQIKTKDALERNRVKERIDKELGTDQLSFWDLPSIGEGAKK